ncbi:Reverse transcriptase [Mucinivorans hirudinis]|uniref:Reverse transcriptase n=1 Tax=Mucinivorans hirudinis TaxID=1433126 RepID=A0A060RDL6_9BACT|nr:Reverse transcriptase [Mucinivorans hirudinis]
MITNIKHLCYILKTDINNIQNIIDNIGDYYISWEKIKIDKNTGNPVIINGQPKKRQLNSTKIELKKIQKRIYRFLLSHVDIPSYAYGGVAKKDNVLNAKHHQGNKYIFTTDLKSYFPSINNTQVFDFFIEIGCTPTISRILTQLTTYKYQLPQGVPTSTLLANLLFMKTGIKLEVFAVQNDIKFSSFVDDLTFSSKKCFKDKVQDILDILKQDGYRISHNKTFYKTNNPIITGVVCQNNRLKLEHSYYKRLVRLNAETKEHSDNDIKRKSYDGLRRYCNKVKSTNK